MAPCIDGVIVPLPVLVRGDLQFRCAAVLIGDVDVIVPVDEDGRFATPVASHIDPLAGPTGAVMRSKAEAIAAVLPVGRIGDVGVIVRVDGDPNRAKEGARCDLGAGPRGAVVVYVFQRLTRAGVGRVRDVKFIVVVDDHVNVPAVGLPAIFDSR